MKKPLMHSLIVILVSGLLFLSFNNCSRIEFANKEPSLDNLKSQDVFVGNPLTSAAKAVLSKMCAVITRCHSDAKLTDCESSLPLIKEIDYQLGLSQGSVQSFADILQSEASGTLRANDAATESCLTAVENLSCSDSRVQNAFDSSNSNFFAKAGAMIPTAPGSCPAIFNQPPAQSEYYVSPTGSDSNDGTKSRPWATITHASQNLVTGQDGAIVHVAPGIYNFAPQSATPAYIFGSASVITSRSGTATAPITYISDQQGGAKIVATNTAAGWYNSGHYVRIVGFEIEGTSSTSFGIYSDGSYGQMVGNHIHHIPVTKNCSVGEAAGGIIYGYYTESHDNDTIGNSIHDIGPLPGNGLPQSAYCNQAHGVSYRQARGKIQNNIFYRVNTWAFSSWHTASNFQISHNLFFNNGAKGSNGLVGGAISIAGEPGVGTHDNTTVSNNIIRNNNGWGISESSSFGTHNAYLNNLLFSNSSNLAIVTAPIGTLTVDPQMVDFKTDGTGNYQLLSSSPAIDAGTLNCAAATGNGNCTPSIDMNGLMRPQGPGLDLGPLEFRP